MKTLFTVAFALTISAISTLTMAEEKKSALDFEMKTLQGEEVDLETYKGKVILAVNVASECGMTPQYEALQAMYKAHKEDGLVVIGFPCNQFGGQEPGSATEISKFCTTKYGVTFPMFAKIEVNGEGAAPLYQHLTKLDTKPKGPGKVTWNFEKFLIDRNGKVVARFSHRTKPDSKEVMTAIKAELEK